MEYFFRTEKMSVGYQHEPLIENIEIALKQGEILTLIGPNGAGKSTVLKSIAKQLGLITGVIYLGKHNLEEMSPSALSQTMAVVFTQKISSEFMTCEDIVATGRYPYTGRFGILSPIDKKVVKESMELVNVTAIKDQDFTKISDGQRQRVMLARAICQEPKILILDEPTSYLDIRYKLEFLSILQKMQKKKKLTVIMSLHELELAEKISDQIMCLNGQYVDKIGSPEEIFREGYLTKLFHLSEGSFDETNGNIELSSVSGDDKVFVIAGGGTGRKAYRRLQREQIPFVTGILYANDLDYPVAKALAVEVIKADSFEPMTKEQIEEARRNMDICKKVICCKKHFGTYEQANQELLDYAKQCHKEIEMIEE